jgi:arylsulfatase A-like enzyme
LIMRLPGVIPEARVIDNQLASLVDLMPSILDIIGAPPAKGMQGRSLRVAWEGGSQEAQQAVYAELRPATGWRSINPNLGRGMKMIQTLNAKYIEGNEGQRELYLTNEDPRDEHNALDRQADLAQTLGIALHAWQARTVPAGQAGRLKLTPERIRQLRTLGYIR